MNILTTLKAARSLIAGILIGGAAVVTVFAAVASPSGTQTVLVIAAAIVLVLGYALQVSVTRHIGATRRALLAV